MLLSMFKPSPPPPPLPCPSRHAALLPTPHAGNASAPEVEAARKLDPGVRAQLRALLSGVLPQCPCCADIPEDPVASTCGHIFCQQCAATQREGTGRCRCGRRSQRSGV